MTEQSPDWVFYQGRRYQMVTEISQTYLKLREWGVPRMIYSTGCKRGYQADYEIDENKVFLTRLEVADVTASQETIDASIASIMEELPSIEGVFPTAEFMGDVQSLRLKDMHYEIMPSYSIAYHLRYFYEINYVFTLFYREDRKFVSPILIEPFPDEVMKIAVKKGHVQNLELVTEQLASIRQSLGSLPLTHEDRKPLYSQQFDLLQGDSFRSEFADD
jgi:hypothetical protein